MKIISSFKSLVFIYLALLLSSCASLKKTEDNIRAVENGSMAAVISGCKVQYATSTLLIPHDAEHKCTALWRSEDKDAFSISSLTDVEFVKPGTYEFIGYRSIDSSYTKYPGAIYVFNPISLKGGDVVYIGHMNVDSRHTKSVVESMSFANNQEVARAYLQENYPEFAKKMRTIIVSYSPAAQQVKNIFSSAAKNKK